MRYQEPDYEYNGYRLYSELDEEEDNRKIWHEVVNPSGERKFIDFTPYSYIGADDFKLLVDLGLPARDFFGARGPINHNDLTRVRDLLARVDVKVEDIPMLLKLTA